MNQLWEANQDYIRVLLKDVEVEARVGLHPWEQHPERPTRLIVSVEVFASLTSAADADKASIIDYDSIRDELKTWKNRPHTPLLETLAEKVVRLVFEIPKAEACRVSIVKPDIFNEAAAAGVEIYRRRAKK